MSELKLASEEKRIVWAEVYVPNVPDTDGDFMDQEGVEKAAYQFMADMNLKKIDVQHTNDLVPGAVVVESFLARKGDPDFIEGAWVVGVHVPDDATWSQIKKGEINGFSLEALVKGEHTTLEIEIPPVVHGTTAKAADHEHEFYVTYDTGGNLVGGRTDTVNGHSHVIQRGTLTEKSEGHDHRFSFVEAFIPAPTA
jgi:hypothetical protein